ncbi:MAG: hypothetical protein JW915_00220 [Chitinispirillaceae bacterium]|nr:hypothetical protein [Chitinispirillaceae bacterium]
MSFLPVIPEILRLVLSLSFIEDDTTIKKILKHCGKWKESIPRPPPQIADEPAAVAGEVTLDYNFFKQNYF